MIVLELEHSRLRPAVLNSQFHNVKIRSGQIEETAIRHGARELHRFELLFVAGQPEPGHLHGHNAVGNALAARGIKDGRNDIIFMGLLELISYS